MRQKFTLIFLLVFIGCGNKNSPSINCFREYLKANPKVNNLLNGSIAYIENNSDVKMSRTKDVQRLILSCLNNQPTILNESILPTDSAVLISYPGLGTMHCCDPIVREVNYPNPIDGKTI